MNKYVTCFFFLALSASLPAQAQVCQVAIPASAPDSRYQVNGNGTVTDLQTGLMWKQCAEGLSGTSCSTGTVKTFLWQQALQRPSVINTQGGFAGHTDWRLPNVKELESLREISCDAPAVNITVFPNTKLSIFVWSSSPYGSISNASNISWYVEFINGSSTSFLRDSIDSNFNVRLVRGGQ